MQLAHARDTPCREWCLAQHVKEGCRVPRDDLARLFQLAAGGTFFQPLNCRVGNPNHGAGTSRTSVSLKKATRRANNGQGKSLSCIAQLTQANSQRCILSGAIARFEVSQPLNDTHSRVGRDRVIGKAQQACKRDGRSVKFRRRDLDIISFQRIALPDQNNARMRAQNGAMLGKGRFKIGRPVLVLSRCTARAI